MGEKSLKEKILEEMVVQYRDAMDKNYERVKKILKLTPTGKVDIVVDKTKLTSDDIISLYLIGKMYSKEAGLSPTEGATNKELMEELGMPEGTMKSTLKRLRDVNRAEAIEEGNHKIALHLIDRILSEIEPKIKS